MANYKYDKDLEFLEKCSNEDLKLLYDVLVYDPKDDGIRLTEELTTSAERGKYGNDYKKYYKRIYGELQLYGGNTFVNMFRGSGVQYSEVLDDVLSHLKIKPCSSVEINEMELITHFFRKIIDSLSESQLEELIGKMDIKEDVEQMIKSGKSSKAATLLVMQTLLKQGGFKTYQALVIVVNFIWKILFGRGLTIAGNALLTKWMSVFLGPIATALMGIFTLNDIAGPAYRVTVPSCLIVALLRKKVEAESSN